MATTHTVTSVGCLPSHCVKTTLKSNLSALGYQPPSTSSAQQRNKSGKVLLRNSPYADGDDDDADDDNNDNEDETTNKESKARKMNNSQSRLCNQDPFRRRRQDFLLKYDLVSHNTEKYVLTRSRGLGRLEYQYFDKAFGLRDMLLKVSFNERPLPVSELDKICCSQWVTDHHVAMGTKCNRIMLYDINARKKEFIKPLSSASFYQSDFPPIGIFAMDMNPSRELLATTAMHSNGIAVYTTPTFNPVCVGEAVHDDLILGMSWLDDMHFVSGSVDSKIALWKMDNKPLENQIAFIEERRDEMKGERPASTPEERLPQPYGLLKSSVVAKCKDAKIVRDIIYNPRRSEIVLTSQNAFIQAWDARRFRQKLTKKLSHYKGNMCLARMEDCSLYAVGSKSHTTLIDPRSLSVIKEIRGRHSGCNILSLSFFNNLLNIGTGFGELMFYDIRAGEYLGAFEKKRPRLIMADHKGWVKSSGLYEQIVQKSCEYPTIRTHCFDSSGIRLFTAGGPRYNAIAGCYAALWY